MLKAVSAVHIAVIAREDDNGSVVEPESAEFFQYPTDLRVNHGEKGEVPRNRLCPDRPRLVGEPFVQAFGVALLNVRFAGEVIVEVVPRRYGVRGVHPLVFDRR